MTTQQYLAVAVIAAMMVLFLMGRIRYDLVAALGLLAALLVGIVPAGEAFSGFSDDIVIVVGSALVVSAAIARTGVLEAALNKVSPHIRSERAQVFALVFTVTVLSAVIKNIGALAMMIPIAMQIARRENKSASIFLMPMSFGALLGGTVTLIGTSPNIIVARMREELTGEPFGMFDFTPVGLGIALSGVVFLTFGYKLLPRDRRGASSMNEAVAIKDYVTEARVAEGSALVDRTLADFKAMAEGGSLSIIAIVRDKRRIAAPLPDAAIREGDILLLSGDPDVLEAATARAGLVLEGEDRPAAKQDPTDEIGSVEGVVDPRSLLVGRTVSSLLLFERWGINLVAVSRAGERLTERIRDIRLRAGDVVVLNGNRTSLPHTMKEIGVLPLADRSLVLGSRRKAVVPLVILAATIVLVGFFHLPVAIGFFGAAVLMMLTGALPLREAYDAVEWPILIMLGALIPVSDALRTTGTTDLLASWLSGVAHSLPPWGALALILVVAMAVTPFLNNAATVLVMAPIAAGFAKGLGYQPEPFLMAVALGAACDFLTPIGHQCNTLVMGPGGYRFGDYARLGFPLSILVVVAGVPLILMFWAV
jgi:di/tricarboxylate transporter